MRVRITGKKTFPGKKGPCYVVSYLAPFSNRDVEGGAVGKEALSTFIDENIYNRLTPDMIGKDADLIYNISGRNAYLDDIVPVK